MAINLWVNDPETLRGRGTAFIVWGVALLLFGVAVLAWPNITGAVLVALVGACILISGLALVYGSWRLRERMAGLWITALLPALGVSVFGLVVLVWPDAVSTVLVLVLAALAIIAGFGDIVSALALVKLVVWWWVRMVRGLLLAGAGVWVILSGVSGLAAIGAAIGVWALFVGAVTLVFGVLALRVPSQV